MSLTPSYLTALKTIDAIGFIILPEGSAGKALMQLGVGTPKETNPAFRPENSLFLRNRGR